MTAVLRIGTRGSRLALAQAEWARRRLEAADAGLRAELVVIKTSGDRLRDVPLHQVGGKGLFVKELESALREGAIDCAVHSLKDLPGELAPGLTIAAVPEREDPHDVAITLAAGGLAALPHGARIGTSSPRRAALVRMLWPDLTVVALRGNVDTRLAKREAGVVEATLLALAGLKRLGVAHVGTPVPEDEILPAVGQGAVCIECRADDARTRAWLAAIDHRPTAVCVAAEHAMLAVLDGSCRTPIAGHAVLSGDSLRLRGLIVKPDGSELLATERQGPAGDAQAMGRDAGLELKRRGGPGFLST